MFKITLIITSRLQSSHTATYLARKIFECAQYFDIVPQLLAMIGDNHNVNPRMVDTLRLRHLDEDSMVGVDTFVGCGDHQIDLGVRVRPCCLCLYMLY